MDSSSELAIQAHGLRKTYARQVALDGLSFAIRPGEVVGLLGPNGAGKTTAVKILTGLVRATAGSAAIFGVPVAQPEARRRIGYLPEHFRFPEWLTGMEVLQLHARLAGVLAARGRAHLEELLELVGLAGRGSDRVRGYSKGMTQRLGLAQALIGHPDAVLLDEPTSALDPLGRREIRQVIRGLKDAGVAVLLNSHLLSEVELTCDHVVIIDHGRVVRSGSLEELRAARVEIRIRLDHLDQRAVQLLAAHGDVIAVDHGEALVAASEIDVAPRIAAALVGAGYELHALVPLQRSLEDVFVGLVQPTDS